MAVGVVGILLTAVLFLWINLPRQDKPKPKPLVIRIGPERLPTAKEAGEATGKTVGQFGRGFVKGLRDKGE